jgi:hypothetical protein
MLGRLFVLLAVLVLVTHALWADDALPHSVLLSPSGTISSRLDDEQPDTLFYDNGQPSSYYNTTNYWVYTRFTPPAAFQLRSIYIILWNPGGSAVPCSLFVHLPSGTSPGTQLGAAGIASVEQGIFWYDVNLPQPIDFAANQDFLICVGRAPGGSDTQGWHVLFDNAATANRSRRTGSNGNHMGPYSSITPGDYPIRAGGEFVQYVDVEATECYNAVNVAPQYNMLPGLPVHLDAAITNRGTSHVDTVDVSWTVRGPSGNTVFTGAASGLPMNADADQQVEATALFTPATEGEYVVTCRVTSPRDANHDNDTTMLRFFVGDLHRWFRYDDNLTSDVYSTFSAGNGWGITFAPTSYTASIESIRVNLQSAGSGDFRIYLNGDTTPTGDPVWQDMPAVNPGWNTIAVSPPVLIYQGQKFTVAYLYSGVPLGKDGNPPNCAEISHMGTIAWQAADDGATWYDDTEGNWSIQAYLDTTSEQSPFPIIALNEDSLLFGQVDTSGTTFRSLTFMVYNLGSTNALGVTSMYIRPLNIGSVFTILPTTLTVQPGDSQQVEVRFNPSAVRAYNGWLVLANNSMNKPLDTLIVRGEGTRPQAADDHGSGLPQTFALQQNYPNPFNPSTEIRFALPTAARVRLTVFDVLGQQVAELESGMLPAGFHVRTFDASRLTTGIYFYRLEAGSFTDIKKMMLLK